ncbi:MAG: ATP-binding protein [Planctomycetaceae bacterium]|nr:ATP-binding protein [Planctomycetaceae bacterium]
MGLPKNSVLPPASVITPNLAIRDPLAAYWFAQVGLRLRREVSWCWYQRMQQPEIEGVLPPVTDAAAENLDLVRNASQKQQFFQDDLTGGFLSDQIELLNIPEPANSRWAWVVDQLDLSRTEQFVLALGLAPKLDAGLAPIFATCLNDLSRPYPTLALAQRLWDNPLDVGACADSGHPLFRYGLLCNLHEETSAQTWHRSLEVPSIIAQQLIDPDSPLPYGFNLQQVEQERELDASSELLIARLRIDAMRMQLVPLLGPRDVNYSDWAAIIGKRAGSSVVSVPDHMLRKTDQILAIACLCWMNGVDILLPDQWVKSENARECNQLLTTASELPLRWYLPLEESSIQNLFTESLLTPPLLIEGLDFPGRVQTFIRHLGVDARQQEIGIEECARRFRFQEKMIARVARAFVDGSMPLTQDNLLIACTNESMIEMDNLAQLVEPRFGTDELILPPQQAAQFAEIVHAMQSLAVVHYHWGTARVWNESGLSVLFCGPPGTGKTMGAEVIAHELKLPMYRIDLSQVVNKYIGETEKNLKRIFDAAELHECILFCDEADALFGKRTDVKDAHDRFANIEISYLLERMERFKGLAILATNRRRDLDEAFMRRLRYVIEFPVPDFNERKRIWNQVFPRNVDISDLDIHFLAKQFQLSGGYIRSIAFNACLRAADLSNPAAAQKVEMRDVVLAVRRELEKMNRSITEELFGDYRELLEEKVPQ